VQGYYILGTGMNGRLFLPMYTGSDGLCRFKTSSKRGTLTYESSSKWHHHLRLENIQICFDLRGDRGRNACLKVRQTHIFQSVTQFFFCCIKNIVKSSENTNQPNDFKHCNDNKDDVSEVRL